MKMMKKKKYNMGGRVDPEKQVIPKKRRKRGGTEYDQAMADIEYDRKMKALAKNKRSGLFGKAEMTKAEARKLGLTGKKMAGGGAVMKYNMGGKVPTYAGMSMMAEGGMVKKKKKVSKKKSIDGVARRGRTKGRMV